MMTTVEEEHQEQLLEQEYQDTEIWKKWFARGATGGFLSVKTWLQAGKLIVDIGTTEGSKLVSQTAVWCPVIPLAVYLKAVVSGDATKLFPADTGKNLSAEGFLNYGGSVTKDGPVSRLLKIHHWRSKSGEEDLNGFEWKTGMFGGIKTPTGAFMPDYTKVLGQNLIRVTRLEMHELSYRVDLALTSYAAQNPNWAVDFSTKRSQQKDS